MILYQTNSSRSSGGGNWALLFFKSFLKESTEQLLWRTIIFRMLCCCSPKLREAETALRNKPTSLKNKPNKKTRKQANRRISDALWVRLSLEKTLSRMLLVVLVVPTDSCRPGLSP